MGTKRFLYPLKTHILERDMYHNNNNCYDSWDFSVKKIIEACATLGIENLTLYAFSTENWNRPKLEVQTLMKLLVSSLKKERKRVKTNKNPKKIKILNKNFKKV